jgi:peroxin-5
MILMRGILYHLSQNVLQHEASVLDDPRDARAWFSLGIRQQENERDDQAIQALLQSIRLEPSLREAYLALSVSYANEGDLREAHNVLEKWISIFHNDQEEGTEPLYATMGKIERHQALADRLMQMARIAPHGDIDADIQVALGILFNASEVSRCSLMVSYCFTDDMKRILQEYDKAQDCFRVALQARQDVRVCLVVTQFM